MNGQPLDARYSERSWLRLDPAGGGAGAGAGAGGTGAGGSAGATGNGGALGGTGGGAGAGAGASGSGSAQDFKPPAGHRLVSDADWTAREQARELAEKYGRYGKPEELEAFAPMFEAAKTGKIDPRMLAAMLKAPAGQGSQDADSGKPMTPAEMMEQLRRESREERALEEWQSGVKGFSKVREEQLKALLGEGATPEELEFYGYAADGLMHQHRGTLKFPDGHPLAGRFMPALDAENSKPAWQKLAELRTKMRGGTLAAIGDAANRASSKGRGTPAGNAGTQGKGGENSKESAIDRANAELEAQFA